MKHEFLQCKRACRKSGLRWPNGIASFLVAVLFMGIVVSVHAQSRTITGTVVDDTGSGLPGVTVLVKGTTQGVITDIDGNYSLPVDGNQTVVFSYIGFETQEVQVGDRTTIEITLIPNIDELEEVVVVGYGAVKKSDVTGAISSVGAKTISEVPAPNVTQALQGRVAGVDLQRTSSRPGAGMRIRVRGSRSLGGDSANEPLVVLDGIPYLGGLNSINQGDIKSIDILKDASATAIYGSRGSNGVIIITTKRGRAGESRVSYSGYHGISSVLDNYEVFNGDEYRDFILQAGTNDLTTAEKESVLLGRETNWQDLMLVNGLMTNHQLTFTGGSDKTQYLFSAGYFKETGAIPKDAYNRNSLRISIDHKVNDRIKLGVSTQTTYEIRTGESQNPFGGLINLSPLYKPYTDDGEVNRFPAVGHIDDPFTWNPLQLWIDDAWASKRRILRSFTSFYGEVKIIEGLKYKLNVGLDGSFTKRGNFNSALVAPRGASNGASILYNHGYNYTLENILTYNKTFADKHSLGFTGLFSVQENEWSEQNFDVSNVANNSLQYFDFEEAQNLQAGFQGYDAWGLVSYMARINYSYDDRYLLTLTGRIDGSSRLSDGNEYFIYPAAAASWNIHNESFMNNVEPISRLKLRVGYGRTSNQAIGSFAVLGQLSPRAYDFDPGTGENGYEVTQLPNDNLAWEFTTTTNIGLDFGLFTNKITGSVEVYQQDTEDILQNVSLPTPAGVSSFQANIGETRNRGIEVSLNALIVEPTSPGGFSFEIDANFFSWTEEITQLFDTLQRNVNNGWFVGEPIDVIYDYKKIGIWQLGEEDEATAFDGVRPGDIRVADLNGNGIRDDEDRSVLGSLNPDWMGGLTARFGYKGFDLSVVTFARVGGLMVSTFHTGSLEGRRNQAKVDYWTPENPTNAYPRTGLQFPEYQSTMGIFDATYMKIRSINLGYNLPASLINNVGINSARVYFTALNPFKAFFSDVVDAGVPDPEPNSQDGGSVPTGFGNSLRLSPNTPIMRTFMVGVNIEL